MCRECQSKNCCFRMLAGELVSDSLLLLVLAGCFVVACFCLFVVVVCLFFVFCFCFYHILLVHFVLLFVFVYCFFFFFLFCGCVWVGVGGWRVEGGFIWEIQVAITGEMNSDITVGIYS